MMKRLSSLLTILLLSLMTETLHAQYFPFGKNKVQYKNFEWNYVQSEHFDVYFTEGGEYLGKFSADALEGSYEQIKRDFKFDINSRIAVMIYKSHNDFQQTNVIGEYLPEGVGGVTELYKNRIVVPFEGDYKKFRHVIHHELVHAVVNDMIYGGSVQSAIANNIRLQIPLWYNEGIAEYEALGWDTNSDMFINDAIINNYLPPIPYLGGYFAYRGGQSMWKFIADKYGKEKVGEIMQRLRASRNVEFAFRGSIGLSVEELSEKWMRDQKVNYWPEIANREDASSIMKRLTDHRKDGSSYNTSPAISPQGDRYAYITDRNGVFDIYIGSTINPQDQRMLISGQRSPNFEELKILTPGLTWAPDGKRLALATKSGDQDAIMIIETESGKIERLTFELDGIYSVDWSRDGKRLAFVGNHDYKSDIYIYDMSTKELTNVTNDVFSDNDPAWSPDGTKLYFSSDRKAYTDIFPKAIVARGGKLEHGSSTREQFKMRDHDYSQTDLYELNVGNISNASGVGSSTVRRLTATAGVDESSPVSNPDGTRLLFVSDQNGMYQVYELLLTPDAAPLAASLDNALVLKAPTEFKVKPVTNLLSGIQSISLSYDGNKMIGVCLDYAGFDVYMLRTPFERTPKGLTASGELTPTPWGKRLSEMRVARQTLPPGNAAMATMAVSLANMQPELSLRKTAMKDLFSMPTPATPPLATQTDTTKKSPATTEKAKADSQSTYKDVKVDFKNFVFDKDFKTMADDTSEFAEEAPKRIAPKNNLTEDGDYRVRRYKLSFSPDIVYGGAGYSALYGAQGSAVFAFSDLLGNHQISVSTNLQLDLRNSNYGLTYYYLGERTDFGLNAFHTANFLGITQDGITSFFRYRIYGATGIASYPFDRFNRVDAGLGYLTLSKENLDNSFGNETTSFLYPSLTYTHDDTRPGFYSPSAGTRYAVSLSSGVGDKLSFGTLLADYRLYLDFWRYYSFVVRLSGATSFGRTPQKFFIGGTENWINRQFAGNNIPISDIQDFIFTTPAIPLRGFDYNAKNGSNFALTNLELRFPFLQYLAFGPVPIPFYYLQGVAFMDVGSAWTGSEFRGTADVNGRTRLNDILAGAGWGVRSVLFYFVVRFDMAWSFDLINSSQPKYYISIGGDF